MAKGVGKGGAMYEEGIRAHAARRGISLKDAAAELVRDALDQEGRGGTEHLTNIVLAAGEVVQSGELGILRLLGISRIIETRGFGNAEQAKDFVDEQQKTSTSPEARAQLNEAWNFFGIGRKGERK